MGKLLLTHDGGDEVYSADDIALVWHRSRTRAYREGLRTRASLGPRLDFGHALSAHSLVNGGGVIAMASGTSPPATVAIAKWQSLQVALTLEYH